MGESDGGSGSPPPEPAKETNLYLTSNAAYDQFKVVFECIPSIPASSSSDSKPYLSKFKIGQHVSSIISPSEVLDYTRLSRTRIVVCVQSATSANLLVTKTTDAPFKAFIPVAYLYKYGILRDVDTDFSDQDILENIDARNFKVVSIQRLNRRINVENSGSKYVPSSSIKLVFEGQSLPAYVYLFHVKGEIEAFLQPVLQCFKCFRYGHTNARCRSPVPKCKFCSEVIPGDMKDHICNKKFCCNCHDAHCPSSKQDCPEFKRQSNIKNLMVSKPLSFHEACLIFPRKASPNAFSSRLSHRRPALALGKNDFPALVSTVRDPSAPIPNLVIPLTSGVNSMPSSSSFSMNVGSSSSSEITHKRRLSPPQSQLIKKRINSAPNPLLDFNSSVMKDQLFTYNQFPGQNGVCLTPNNVPSGPSFSPAPHNISNEHTYASLLSDNDNVGIKLKESYIPPIDFSQTPNNSDNVLASNTSSPTPPGVGVDQST
uniref:CCHC-type domain-containing protein n=1 Tax=Cacopsylla melanoneura TaxID=428564 RepID=A0A8D8Q8F0_9HEMI